MNPTDDLPVEQARRLCAEQAAPPGSDRDTAIRAAERQTRGRLLAVWSLWDAVAGVLHQVRDDNVARQKLAWWREELSQLPDTARHPVTRLWMLEALTAPDLLRNALQLCQRLSDIAAPRPFLDSSDLDRHCRQTGLPLARLLVLAADPEADDLEAYAAALGPPLRRSELLLNLRDSARLGRCHLPAEPLHQAGLPPDELLQLGREPGLKTLLGSVAASIADDLASAERLIPANRWNRQAPNRVIAALHCALWRELAGDGHPLITHRTELTPLRRFWIARRCIRRRQPGPDNPSFEDRPR